MIRFTRRRFRMPLAASDINNRRLISKPRTQPVVTEFDGIKSNYQEIPLSLTNNGHTIRVNTPKGTLSIGKSEYELAQFHFHAPSEHTVNGVRYPMEIHFVNGRTDGRAAVMGVFIKSGRFNPAFQEILDHAPVAVGETADSAILFRPDRLLPKQAKHFYSYAGSSTTPPCTEGVRWLVYKDPIEASDEQIKAFRDKYYDGIACSVQQLNGRKLDEF